METPLPGFERSETREAASPGEQQCQATPKAKKAPLRHRSCSPPIRRVSPATTTNPGAALRTEADPQTITKKRARISEPLTQRFIKRGEARARRFQKFRPAEPACRSKKCNLACCNYLNTIDGGRRQEWLSDVRRIADDAWDRHGYDGEDVHICFGIQYLKGADLRIKGTRKRSKTRVKSSKPSYFLPCIGLRSVDDDPGDLDLQVSLTYFAAVYGFSSNSRRCTKLCKIARGCTPIQHGVLRPRNVRPSHTTGAVVAVHEFDLYDDVMITYDGRDIRVCVSRRIESNRGSGTRYDINFPGDQWELDSDGRKTGARITTLKGVPADRLTLAPTRRCRRQRQSHW